MERSAGEVNAIKEEMSEKKTACMWEDCMPDNYSVWWIFAPSQLNLSLENVNR